MPDNNVPDSLLIPTTYVYDIENIDNIDIGLKNFLVQLTTTVNTMAVALNMKDTGYYVTNEMVNSQSYFNTVNDVPVLGGEPRPVYRKVINFGALPNAAIKSVAHGIQNIVVGAPPTSFRFTRIYGCASAPGGGGVFPQFIPIPYASTNSLAESIEMDVTYINVRIRTGSDRSAFTTCYVVLEYVKES